MHPAKKAKVEMSREELESAYEELASAYEEKLARKNEALKQALRLVFREEAVEDWLELPFALQNDPTALAEAIVHETCKISFDRNNISEQVLKQALLSVPEVFRETRLEPAREDDDDEEEEVNQTLVEQTTPIHVWIQALQHGLALRQGEKL